MDERSDEQRELAPAHTEFQVRMLDALAQSRHSSCSTATLAKRMDTSVAAICSAGRALERCGVVTHSRIEENGHASLIWAIKVKPDSGPGAAENPAADH